MLVIQAPPRKRFFGICVRQAAVSRWVAWIDGKARICFSNSFYERIKTILFIRKWFSLRSTTIPTRSARPSFEQLESRGLPNIPPEQADGSDIAPGTHNDVSSPVAVLYALLSGQPPFDDGNFVGTIIKVRSADPASRVGLTYRNYSTLAKRGTGINVSSGDHFRAIRRFWTSCMRWDISEWQRQWSCRGPTSRLAQERNRGRRSRTADRTPTGAPRRPRSFSPRHWTGTGGRSRAGPVLSAFRQGMRSIFSALETDSLDRASFR